jgi:hypothetical protein
MLMSENRSSPPPPICISGWFRPWLLSSCIKYQSVTHLLQQAIVFFKRPETFALYCYCNNVRSSQSRSKSNLLDSYFFQACNGFQLSHRGMYSRAPSVVLVIFASALRLAVSFPMSET